MAVSAVASAVVLVAACDTTSSFTPGEQNWGFINVAARSTSAGEFRTAPFASFFRGSVSSVPNSLSRTDSCFAAGEFVEPVTTFANVTYLDAGASVATTIGGVKTELPRGTTNGVTTYGLTSGTTVGYRPGDSVIVQVPGATGGYPTAEVRGKTAEAFTIQSIAPSLDSALQLRWTPATDGASSLIVSLQYTTSSGTGRAQEIRCSFTDDGVDSIPARQHAAWSAQGNSNRKAVFTRLRTNLIAVPSGAIEFISTFAVPTPLP